MHSHCAHCTVTVPKNLHMQICVFWMVAWLEHAECQLQAVDQVFFAVCVLKNLAMLDIGIVALIFQFFIGLNTVFHFHLSIWLQQKPRQPC